ncbi:Uma2 family endonuclease [Nostoc sp. FACHB-87]|uniref:Uma2 family endonuclease n=1 Tax=Nostocaceae TaxID=1162 RepID=UPI001689E6AC|nr:MULTISPECIES: Uma2 family endonuclease [Nostocaceae]MBD2299808.1 Uma2 family endonuclease [Nostoc sp. FACHB-190]MBD2459043.1 Uma2 family endonuclease [Nostoc sp. FACHB-87]MBD2480018.1 Uma2 family endonuclease [Anabaena sp. FACHB-83]
MVSSLKELIDEPELGHSKDPEEKFISSGVSWDSYESLLAKLENNSHYRVNYLDGILEIVSPSIRHEKIKTNLGMLLERFFYSKRIRFVPMGSSTFKNKARKAGAEPDECYCIGEEKKVPDLAIEVVLTSGSVSKLEIYRRLGVAEVWFWERNQFKLYHLRDNSQEEQATVYPETYGYEPLSQSEILPELDISLLEQCLTISDSIQAIDEFEQGLKAADEPKS